MHVGHFIHVQAESADEAVTVSDNVALDCAHEDSAGGWADWWTVGGRWDGGLLGGNVVRIVDDLSGVETILTGLMRQVGHEYRETARMLTGVPIPSLVDGEPEQMNISGIDTACRDEWLDALGAESVWEEGFPVGSMAFYYAEKLVQMALLRWNPESLYYSNVTNNANIQNLLDRVLANDVTTEEYLVLYDFHY